MVSLKRASGYSQNEDDMPEDYLEIPNRFLRYSDYSSVLFQQLRKEFERVYCDLFGGQPHTAWKKPEYSTRIHWSRDWEYPWAVINGAVASGHKVLDCGCGGPPFLPFLALYGAQCYGVDMNADDWMKVGGLQKFIRKLQRRQINSLRQYGEDPQKVIGRPLTITSHSMTDLPYEDEYFDRVFCLSVLEHLQIDDAHKSMQEMARVLKKSGRLVITMDFDGEHVDKSLDGTLFKVVESAGLEYYGPQDFSVPEQSEIPGMYNVVGLVLKK